jgi:hypothetical protein
MIHTTNTSSEPMPKCGDVLGIHPNQNAKPVMICATPRRRAIMMRMVVSLVMPGNYGVSEIAATVHPVARTPQHSVRDGWVAARSSLHMRKSLVVLR